MIKGLRSNDSLNAMHGNDTMYGQWGHDRVIGAWGQNMLYGGAGGDTPWGAGSHDLVHGGAGNDLLQGNAGIDTLQGRKGAGLLLGSDGNDMLTWGLGADRFALPDGGIDTAADFKSNVDMFVWQFQGGAISHLGVLTADAVALGRRVPQRQPYPLDITIGDVFLDPDGNPGGSGGVTCLVCHVTPRTMRSHTDFMVVDYSP